MGECRSQIHITTTEDVVLVACSQFHALLRMYYACIMSLLPRWRCVANCTRALPTLRCGNLPALSL